MTFKEVIDFRYITASEAKKVMEEVIVRRKEKGEISFEARKTMNYLNAVVKIDSEKARKIVEEAEKLPFVSEEIAIKIAEILPEIPDEVRVIFAKERITLSPEQIHQILDIVQKYKN